MKHAITNLEDQDFRYSNYVAYDTNKIYILKTYQVIKKLAKKNSFKKILDIGCADGSFCSKLANEFKAKGYGVDISKKAVINAKKKGITAKIHSVEKRLPFADNFFDLVIGCEIIEHVYDTDFLISEMNRVLRKGGILILSTPNLTSLINRLKIFFGAYPNFVPEYKIGGAGHIRAYTASVLINQLSKYKLKKIYLTSPNIIFPMTNKHIPLFLKKIAMFFGDFFPRLGSHIIIATKKI